MPDLRLILTRCEYAMFERLHKEGTIYWKHIRGYDTATLNRLVKKGCAILYDQMDDPYYKYWKLANELQGG